MVTSRNQRNTIWFAVLMVTMVAVGFCLIGFWQTYDVKCAYARDWSFAQFPPQFVCRQL